MIENQVIQTPDRVNRPFLVLVEKKPTKETIKQSIVSGEYTAHRIKIYYPKGLPKPPKIMSIKEKLRRTIKATQEDEFNAAASPAENLGVALIAIDAIYDFLKSPILEDRYSTNEHLRIIWEEKIEKIYGQAGKELIENNRLRQNKFGEVISYINILSTIVGTDLKDISQRIDPRASKPEIYKFLSTKTKKKIVADIHIAAVEFLEILFNFAK